MTPETYAEWRGDLRNALRKEGLDPETVDVRLAGSASEGFSGPHKPGWRASDDRIAGNPDAQARLAEWVGDDPERLGSRPFDSGYRLGVDEPSDYDVNISSDDLVARAATYGRTRVVEVIFWRVLTSTSTRRRRKLRSHTWHCGLGSGAPASRLRTAQNGRCHGLSSRRRARRMCRRPGSSSTSETITTGSSTDGRRKLDMPMTMQFKVELRGEVAGEVLDRLRDRLALTPRGRLTDLEDAEFGYRYLMKDDSGHIDLTLFRDPRDHRRWRLTLSYLGRPATRDVVTEVRRDVLLAAEDLGLAVEYVWEEGQPMPWARDR